jgi:hypothetical protein
MPLLNLISGEPWAETWAVMLFPEDEPKRRAYIARLWAGFYPIFEEASRATPLLIAHRHEPLAARTREVRRGTKRIPGENRSSERTIEW